MRLIGLTRVRNESLIIADTLEHLDRFCDGIVVYDDCSSDDTRAVIAKSTARVLALIRGTHWSPDRLLEETRHRRTLAATGIAHKADWLLYVDADERLDVDVRGLVQAAPTRIDGFRLGLLDAYLTQECAEPYKQGPLVDLQRVYGVEERRILMLWRASSPFAFLGADQREPVPGIGCRIAEVPGAVRHFGKAISVAQWEDTCTYYADHFPEPYRSKWSARIGKALHTASDFGGPLLPWEEAVAQASKIPAPRQNLRMLLRRLQVSLQRRFGRLAGPKELEKGLDIAHFG